MLFDLVGLDDSCNIDIGCSNGGFADCDAVLVVGLVFRSRSSKKGQQRGGSGRFLESRRRRLNSQSSSSSSSSSSCKRFGFKRAHFFFLLKWNFFSVEITACARNLLKLKYTTSVGIIATPCLPYHPLPPLVHIGYM